MVPKFLSSLAYLPKHSIRMSLQILASSGLGVASTGHSLKWLSNPEQFKVCSKPAPGVVTVAGMNRWLIVSRSNSANPNARHATDNSFSPNEPEQSLFQRFPKHISAFPAAVVRLRYVSLRSNSRHPVSG